jgi:hypothetical protein
MHVHNETPSLLPKYVVKPDNSLDCVRVANQHYIFVYNVSPQSQRKFTCLQCQSTLQPVYLPCFCYSKDSFSRHWYRRLELL